MYGLISTHPTTALSLGIGISFATLLILEMVNSRRIKMLASPAMEYALKKAQDESDRIMIEARAQARALIERAEADAGHLAAERAQEDVAVEHAHDAALKALRDDFATYVAQATGEAKAASETAKAALHTHFEALATQGGDELRRAVEEIKSQFSSAIQTELERAIAEAKEAGAAYEQARKAATDAHILELVAETTKIVLATGLPEGEHAALVMRALAEAKATHAF